MWQHFLNEITKTKLHFVHVQTAKRQPMQVCQNISTELQPNFERIAFNFNWVILTDLYRLNVLLCIPHPATKMSRGPILKLLVLLEGKLTTMIVL